LAVVGALGAIWLSLSFVAALTAADSWCQHHSDGWFRLRWLTAVASVWVAVFLGLWASAESGRQAVVPGAAALLICGTGCLIFYRLARRVRSLCPGTAGGLATALRVRWLPCLVLAGAVVVWLAGWVVARQARSQAKQAARNVIVIAVDTLRADRVSLLSDHEHDRDLTPNLRRLLGPRSTVFTNAISQSPWTLPAFASIFTGLYPEEHGAEQVTSILSPEQSSLAELLREAGYRTTGIVSGYYVSSQFGMDQGFGEFDESQVLEATAVTSEQVTERALGFLRGRRGDPFFLFVHYFDPHGTYVDHPGFHYADGYSGWLREEAHTEKQHLVVQAKRHLCGPPEHAYIRDLYDEEVAYTDSHLGRLLEFVEAAGLWESTLVIFVSDHGEEFWEHGALGHRCTLYQEVVGVPLVVADPSDGRHSVIRTPVETRWLFGTILDFLSVERPVGRARGPSLLDGSAAAGGLVRSSTHPVLRAEDLGTDSGARVWLSCIIRERWKLVRDHLLQQSELFDLARDSSERCDLWGSEADIADDLAAALAAWDREVGVGRSVAPSGRAADEEQIRRLRSLGYL
jgi:arylsulfatase A-like enzyme